MEYFFKISFSDSKLFLIQEEKIVNFMVSPVQIESTANFISVCAWSPGAYIVNVCILQCFLEEAQKWPKSSNEWSLAFGLTRIDEANSC